LTDAMDKSGPQPNEATSVPEYYSSVRQDILRFIPDGVTSMLEVGTGTGATSSYIKKNWNIARCVGIELFPDAAAIARQNLDLVIEGNLEEMRFDTLEDAPFDLILALDVLEHLKDPWTVVDRLKDILKPGGIMIASIPNVSHFSCAIPFIFKGSWELQDDGILDRTHLRFFVKKTAISLIERPDLKVVSVEPSNLMPHSKAGKLHLATLGLFERFLAIQYVVIGEKT